MQRNLPTRTASVLAARQRSWAMSMVELLTVVAIVGLLAALLLPALNRAQTSARIQRCRLEMDQLVTAITAYESAYGRYPVSDEAVRTAAALDEDMTYGGVVEQTHTWIAGPGAYLTNNCELMAVLLDLEYYADGVPTINQAHARNPHQIRYLNLKLRSDTNAVTGVGLDGIYRDPWGSPYVVALDLNGDGRARDVFYRTPAVSQDPKNPGRGLKGLVRMSDSQRNTFFEAAVPVTVWSTGPDRHLDSTQKADRGANRDNVLSWER